MQLAKALRNKGIDEGSASLEFITAGVLLLVPVVYLIMTLAQIQSATFATEGAARQAARVFTMASDITTAQQQSQQAVRVTLADYGVAMKKSHLSISCNQSECLKPGGMVTVKVTSRISLPGIPGIWGLEKMASVQVSGVSTMPVSRFRK